MKPIISTLLIYLGFCISLVNAQQVKADKSKVNYDFSCMETDGVSTGINFGSDIEKEMLDVFGTEVTIQDEKAVGAASLEKIKKEYRFVSEGASLKKLQDILGGLVAEISTPKGFQYNIYLLDTTLLNAFTLGGNIFVTSEMYKFCKTDDELACIIGHEIAHNELGHIHDQISRIKTANSFGTMGAISAMVGQLLATPYNQKNELHCDMVGIDLALAAGYDACQNIVLWERMKLKEGAYNTFTTLFSSHPYSGKRAVCSRNHLRTNYQKECSK